MNDIGNGVHRCAGELLRLSRRWLVVEEISFDRLGLTTTGEVVDDRLPLSAHVQTGAYVAGWQMLEDGVDEMTGIAIGQLGENVEVFSRVAIVVVVERGEKFSMGKLTRRLRVVVRAGRIELV